MKILISPAKSLQDQHLYSGGNETTPQFLKESNQLVVKLKKLSVVQLGKLMHLSPALAELNYERYQQWESPSENLPSNMPCVFAFTGEVYKGLKAETFTETQLAYAQEKLRILSGLYGMLKPLDRMYPYRLEMGTSWKITPTIPNLYGFWKSKVAAALNEQLKADGDEVIINLASAEYFKVIPKNSLKVKVITPIFKEFKNGTYKIVMMYAKHARGAMARYIIEKELKDPEALKLYNVDGYSYDANQSTDTEWVFVR